MATTTAQIVLNARATLLELTAKFWSDAELTNHAYDGYKDLWRSIIDLNQGHFQTIDETNVSLAASSNVLAGLPTDVFRVELIEPKTLTSSGSTPNLIFTPRAINHPDFTGSRSLGAVSPDGQEVFYAMFSAGPPTGAPQIEVAPQLTAALLAGSIRFIYTPSLPAAPANNPIPGESDHAVYAWIIAHARAKERDDRTPDPTWLAVYGTDKKAILTGLTPRQAQEPDVAEALFESYS